MKVIAECLNGMVRTKIPSMPYDMSPKDYDANLLMIGSAMLLAIAESIAEDDEDTTLLTLDVICECAKEIFKHEVGEYE